MIIADETPANLWQTLSQIPSMNRRGKRRKETTNKPLLQYGTNRRKSGHSFEISMKQSGLVFGIWTIFKSQSFSFGPKMGSSLAHRQQDHYPITAYLTGTIYSHFLALVSFAPNWRESLTTQRHREKKKTKKKHAFVADPTSLQEDTKKETTHPASSTAHSSSKKRAGDFFRFLRLNEGMAYLE